MPSHRKYGSGSGYSVQCKLYREDMIDQYFLPLLEG